MKPFPDIWAQQPKPRQPTPFDLYLQSQATAFAWDAQRLGIGKPIQPTFGAVPVWGSVNAVRQI